MSEGAGVPVHEEEPDTATLGGGGGHHKKRKTPEERAPLRALPPRSGRASQQQEAAPTGVGKMKRPRTANATNDQPAEEKDERMNGGSKKHDEEETEDEEETTRSGRPKRGGGDASKTGDSAKQDSGKPPPHPGRVRKRQHEEDKGKEGGGKGKEDGEEAPGGEKPDARGKGVKRTAGGVEKKGPTAAEEEQVLKRIDLLVDSPKEGFKFEEVVYIKDTDVKVRHFEWAPTTKWFVVVGYTASGERVRDSTFIHSSMRYRILYARDAKAASQVLYDDDEGKGTKGGKFYFKVPQFKIAGHYTIDFTLVDDQYKRIAPYKQTVRVEGATPLPGSGCSKEGSTSTSKEDAKPPAAAAASTEESGEEAKEGGKKQEVVVVVAAATEKKAADTSAAKARPQSRKGPGLPKKPPTGGARDQQQQQKSSGEGGSAAAAKEATKEQGAEEGEPAGKGGKAEGGGGKGKQQGGGGGGSATHKEAPAPSKSHPKVDVSARGGGASSSSSSTQQESNSSAAVASGGGGGVGNGPPGLEDIVQEGHGFKLKLPGALHHLMVEEWFNITRKRRLIPLPRSPSVLDILKAFEREHAGWSPRRGGRAPSLQTERLCNLFDSCLGSVILYRFEQEQYVQQLEGASKKKLRPHQIWGAEHLLRFLVVLPRLLTPQAPTGGEEGRGKGGGGKKRGGDGAAAAAATATDSISEQQTQEELKRTGAFLQALVNHLEANHSKFFVAPKEVEEGYGVDVPRVHRQQH